MATKALLYPGQEAIVIRKLEISPEAKQWLSSAYPMFYALAREWGKNILVTEIEV